MTQEAADLVQSRNEWQQELFNYYFITANDGKIRIRAREGFRAHDGSFRKPNHLISLETAQAHVDITMRDALIPFQWGRMRLAGPHEGADQA